MRESRDLLIKSQPLPRFCSQPLLLLLTFLLLSLRDKLLMDISAFPPLRRTHLHPDHRPNCLGHHTEGRPLLWLRWKLDSRRLEELEICFVAVKLLVLNI
jgi:hypothetical protein